MIVLGFSILGNLEGGTKSLNTRGLWSEFPWCFYVCCPGVHLMDHRFMMVYVTCWARPVDPQPHPRRAWRKQGGLQTSPATASCWKATRFLGSGMWVHPQGALLRHGWAKVAMIFQVMDCVFSNGPISHSLSHSDIQSIPKPSGATVLRCSQSRCGPVAPPPVQ